MSARQKNTQKPEAVYSSSIANLARIDRKVTLRGQAYAVIRRSILTGEFAPSTVLDEKAIARQLGVSRTPVREAIKKLADENLVKVKAQSATIVAPIDRKLIREAFLIRRALEVESVGYAADRIAKHQFQRLKELHVKHTLAIQNRRFADAISRDDDFHRFISEISDLPRLWQAIEISKAQLDRCRHLTVPRPGFGEATIQQHELILAALAKKDRSLSRKLMSDHLEKAYEGIIAFLDQLEAA